MRKIHTVLTMALLTVSLGVGGCGGGGGGAASPGVDPGPGGGPSGFTLTLPLDTNLTGVVGSGGQLGGSASAAGVGDRDASSPGATFRQCLAFDLADVPRTARILSAYLSLEQASVVGDPFSNHGDVVVDHVHLGSHLDARDFDTGDLALGIDVLSTDAALGTKGADVTAAVASDLAAGRPLAQFRLRFDAIESDGDGVDDFVRFVDAPYAATPPVLEITWTDL